MSLVFIGHMSDHIAFLLIVLVNLVITNIRVSLIIKSITFVDIEDSFFTIFHISD